MIVLDLSQEQLSKNSVLAEILQASGILSDSGSSSSESAVTTASEAPAKGTTVVVLCTEVMLHEVKNCAVLDRDTSFVSLVSLVLFCFVKSFAVLYVVEKRSLIYLGLNKFKGF